MFVVAGLSFPPSPPALRGRGVGGQGEGRGARWQPASPGTQPPSPPPLAPAKPGARGERTAPPHHIPLPRPGRVGVAGASRRRVDCPDLRMAARTAALVGTRKGLPVNGPHIAPERPHAPGGRLRTALAHARRRLLALQKPDGHWVGELEGDTILESEYVLLLAFLGREADPRVRKLANYLLRKQLPGGGWAIYPGGAAELSASVKAYFALKLAGHAADEPMMRRHAGVIRSLGGAAGCNSFTRFYLALLG